MKIAKNFNNSETLAGFYLSGGYPGWALTEYTE